ATGAPKESSREPVAAPASAGGTRYFRGDGRQCRPKPAPFARFLRVSAENLINNTVTQRKSQSPTPARANSRPCVGLTATAVSDRARSIGRLRGAQAPRSSNG